MRCAKMLCPIDRINDQRLAASGRAPDFIHLLQKHGPAVGLFEPGYIQEISGSLRINKKRLREPGGERALADSLRAVYDHLLRLENYSALNIQCH
jgi:hypothetical protein